jgi:hypothetical protein
MIDEFMEVIFIVARALDHLLLTSMSARQPFVPQRSVADHSTVPKPMDSQSSNESQQEDTSTHKPFNLAGFNKPKSKKTGTSTLQSRRSFEGIQRPLQVKFSKIPSPRSIIKHPNLKLSNPLQSQNQNQNPYVSSFFPTPTSTTDSASDPQKMSSNAASVSRIATPFKLPSRVNSFANSGENDIAHIPGPAVNNSSFAHGTLLVNSTSQTTTSAAVQSRSLLEKISESTEDAPLSSPFAAGEDESANRNGFVDFSPSDRLGLNIDNAAVTSERSKRSRPEHEEEEEDMDTASTTQKRRKGNGKQVRFSFLCRLLLLSTTIWAHIC